MENSRGNLLVKSAVRAAVAAEEPDMRISEEFLSALENGALLHLSRSILRAKSNGRKTLKAQDV